jgi:hypothetical protein
LENGKGRSLVVRCGGLCRVRFQDSGGVHRTPEAGDDGVGMAPGPNRSRRSPRRRAGTQRSRKTLSYIEAPQRRVSAKAPLNPKDLPTRNTDFLIAIAGLEFRLTPSKISPLIFSNREYIAVFRSDFMIRLSAANAAFQSKDLPPRNAEFLIGTAGLEFRLTHSNESPLTFSNRDYIAVFQIDFAPHLSRISSWQSRVTNYGSQVTSHRLYDADVTASPGTRAPASFGVEDD